MNLSKIFDPELIQINLAANTKDEAVVQLAQMFCKKYPDKPEYEIIAAVHEREKLGNTSMGRGVAFPHARTDMVTGLYVAIGIAPEGIPADTPDGKPLYLVILLLTPRNISKTYLQSLSGLANFARRPETLPALLKAKTIEEVIKIVDDTGINIERELIVGDVMTAEPVTITPDKTIKDVVNLFFKYKISGLPVVDAEGKLIGEISENELLRFALPNYERFLAREAKTPNAISFKEIIQMAYTVTAGEISNKNPLTVELDASLTEAAAMLIQRNAERIMVLSEGKLKGVITKSDIVSKILRG
jgi:PTS system nitrogen regulatory IIA component